MNILLKKDLKGEYKNIEVNDSGLLEDIAGQVMANAKADGEECYDFLLARVNGVDKELGETVEEGDKVELLDMRIHAADLTYQRGLAFIYTIAVRDVYEAHGLTGVRVEIDNSLNKGLYTAIIPGENVDEKTRDELQQSIKQEYVDEIEARMRQIVAEDIPIEKEVVSKDEGVAIWAESGYPEKAELLSKLPDRNYKPVFYRIGNDRNYFFGPMVPSTGYIKLFELRKYGAGILLRFPYYNKPNVMPEYVDDYKLYEAFANEHRWLELLGAQNVTDVNRVIVRGGAKDMILLSEALHEKRIAEIASMIKTKSKRIILIAGPSSSGKTTFAKRLCIQLRVLGLKPLYMGTDDYFVEREESPVDENGEKDYENLNALDINLFSSNMNDLLAGKEVDIPEFDFLEGKKVFGKRLTKIEKTQPIVIEGIHALNGKLTEQIKDEEKFKIYISPLMQINIDSQNRVPTTDARMLRRMVRDYKYRGHSAAGTISEWPKVRAGEDKNIFPYNGMADVVFNSTLAYETCILKKYALPLLEEIKPDEPEYSEAVRLREFFRFFKELEKEDYIPNNSIIREFIGGSVFVE